MPPRPLHRWKSFWLGLLVLAFLGWAWIHSMSHYRSARLSWGNPGRGFTITEECAEIGFIVLRSSAAGTGVSISDGPLGRQHPDWFTPAFTHKVYGNDDHFWFAHWFLILLFLIPWIGFLVWRSRRMKRLAAAPFQPRG